jgi:hypothetical protein
MLVIPMWIHFAAMFAATGFALRVGGRDERLAASGYLMTNLALFGFGAGEPSSPVELEVAVYALAAAGFTVLALWRRRGWLAIPCAVACCELASAVLHGPLRLDAWTYGTVQLGWFYLTWTTIAAASWSTWRRTSPVAA